MTRLTPRTRGQQILAAARHCFTRNGFAATSMATRTSAPRTESVSS